MKKFTKSVLVALTALMALPVSADVVETTTTFDFEDGKHPFTADSRISVAVEDDADKGSKVLVFTNAGNTQNGYAFAHYDFTDVVAKSVKTIVEFDYWNENGGRGTLSLGDALDRGNNGHSGKVTYSSQGAIFWAGSDRDWFFAPTWQDITEKSIDPETQEEITTVIGREFKRQNFTKATFCNMWLHVKVEADVEAGTYSYTITDAESNELLAAEAAPMNGFSLTQIDVFGWINNSKGVRIDNLTITSTEDSSIKYADYTINWVFGETVLKTTTRNGKVGDGISLIASDKDPVWSANRDMKYIFESDNLEGLTIAEEGTVVTLNYREATKWQWWLNAKAGRITLGSKFMEGEEFEGETGYARYYKGFMYNGAAYMIDAAKNSNAYYQINITEDKPGATNIEYTKRDSVVYVAECENMELVGEYQDENGFARDRYAGGRAPSLKTDAYVKTDAIAETAYYNITLSARVGGNGTTLPVYLVTPEGELEVIDQAYTGLSTGPTEYTLQKVLIPAGYAVAFKNAGESAGVELDFAYIKLNTREGIPTGISEVAAKANAENGTMYNLAGQRVQKAVKGLYIVNGKKVVLK